MKEQTPSEARYMKLTEEVIFGLGGYFQRRLATINRKRGESLDLQRQKEEKRKGLSKNKVIRMMQIISYGDWLTDYETEQIAEQDMSIERLTGVMTEVVTLGRVDHAEAELLSMIAICIGNLKSDLRATDSIGQKSAIATVEIVDEAIKALKIIDQVAAAEHEEFLAGIKNEASW